mmetsp:Transcript_32236/g.57690  ORF Transcript_32236/g.57690 Transcript_32236/m.57690 type:complete len:236 (-) Transcript_32236:216-923(-)
MTMSASSKSATASQSGLSMLSYSFSARHRVTSASSTLPIASSTAASFSSVPTTDALSSPSTTSLISTAFWSRRTASPKRLPFTLAPASISNASACCAEGSSFIAPVRKPTASAKPALSASDSSPPFAASRFRSASRALISCERWTLDFNPAAERSSSVRVDSSAPLMSSSTPDAASASPGTGSAAVQRPTSLALQVMSFFCGVDTRRLRRVSWMASENSESETGSAWSGYMCSYI